MHNRREEEQEPDKINIKTKTSEFLRTSTHPTFPRAGTDVRLTHALEPPSCGGASPFFLDSPNVRPCTYPERWLVVRLSLSHHKIQASQQHLRARSHPHTPHLRPFIAASSSPEDAPLPTPQKWLLCTLSWAARSDRTSYVLADEERVQVRWAVHGTCPRARSFPSVWSEVAAY